MKASKAPKRIYIHPTLDNLYGMCERSCDSEIEYTRTDAFIEKAQSFFKQSHHLFHLDGMDLHNFIEDFRKYMKE